MNNTKKYRLTHEELKKEFKEERLKYISKDNILNTICVIMVLIAVMLVFVYASQNGYL